MILSILSFPFPAFRCVNEKRGETKPETRKKRSSHLSEVRETKPVFLRETRPFIRRILFLPSVTFDPLAAHSYVLSLIGVLLQ
jgi:hypothetical protein